MVTYDDFLQTCYDLMDTSTAAHQAFVTRIGNIGYRRAMRYFGRQFEERTKTTTTVAGQQYYQLPVDYSFAKSMKTLVGTYQYPTDEIRSQTEWDDLNRLTNISNTRPLKHFIRLNAGIGGDEIGFWPTPSVNGQTITFVFEAVPADVGQAAFSAGQVSVINLSATVTSNAASFTPSLVGRYFSVQPPSGDGQYYRVANYVSPTSLTLVNYYEGPTASNVGFQVQDLFGIAEESQMIPVYYTMWHFYLMRRSPELAEMYRKLHNEDLEKGRENQETKSHDLIIRRSEGYDGGYGLDYPPWFPSAGISG